MEISLNNNAATEKLLTARGTERREQIVSAAIKQIAAEGLEGFRVRSVALAVGINNATLHHYFPTKEDVIRAVIDNIIEHFAAASRQKYSESQNVTGDELKKHFQMIRRQFAKYPEIFLVLNELSLRAHRDAKIAEFINTANQAWANFLMEIFEKSNSEMTKSDQQILAELFMATFKGLSLQLGEKGIFERLTRGEKVSFSELDKTVSMLGKIIR